MQKGSARDEIVKSAAAGRRMRRGPTRAFRNAQKTPLNIIAISRDSGQPGGFIESQGQVRPAGRAGQCSKGGYSQSQRTRPETHRESRRRDASKAAEAAAAGGGLDGEGVRIRYSPWDSLRG